MIRIDREGPKGRVSRRTLLTGSAVAAGAAAVAWTMFRANSSVAGPTVTVWKSSECTCCGGWVAYMRNRGYKVDVHEMEDVNARKTALAIPEQLWSCHTSEINGYLIEGHVPEAAIAKLLKEHPDVKGLALPGMQSGAPGMDGAPGIYRVLAFDRDGHSRLFLATGV